MGVFYIFLLVFIVIIILLLAFNVPNNKNRPGAYIGQELKVNAVINKPTPKQNPEPQAKRELEPQAKRELEPQAKREPESQNQQSSLNNLSGKSHLGENLSINEVLEEIKANNCVVLDTETTGLSSSDQIIEITICTYDKKVVFDSIVSSKVACSDQARSVHHISDEQIANGMPIESAKVTLLGLLQGKTIISFNADFDCQMLYQTTGFITKKRFCVMKWSESVLDYERWPRLEKVCVRLNIEQPAAHRSLVDTRTTIDIFDKLNDLTQNHKTLLRDFSSIDLNAIAVLDEGETLFLSPNSNIFASDWLIDRYGNDVVGIRSKALKRMLKREGVRIFVKNSRKGKTLKVEYIDTPNFNLPISIEELSNRIKSLNLKNVAPNKYLNLNATITPLDINNTTNELVNGTYYFPSIVINSEIYEKLKNIPIFYNTDRERVAFNITKPKNTMKKMFALGLQGYSSILTIRLYDGKIKITAYHLLDSQRITILNRWDVDGEKSWSGDY